MNPYTVVADTSPCDRCGESAEDHGWTGCECLHEHYYEGVCEGSCDPHGIEHMDSSSVCPDKLGTFEEAEDPRTAC